VALLIFGFGTAARFLVFCFYGNEIEFNCKNFLSDVYETNWISIDKAKLKNLIIMQENLKKSESVRAAGFMNIDMDVFLRVMKAAYSTLAVLRQIKK
jgi:7tm Odorant receptor